MRMRLLILCMSLASPAWSAVTEVGTATLGSDTVGGTSISVARTTTSGSKGLTVQLSYYNGSGAVAPPTLSWNGSAMTTVTTGANSLGGNDRRCATYFIANPAAGSFSLTGTFSGTAYWRLAMREWSNSSATHGGASADSESDTPSVNVASVVAGEVVLDAVTANTPLAVGAGQSTTNSYLAQLAGSQWGGASIDTSGTGTVAMNWTSDSSTWCVCAMALTEDAGGGAVVPKLPLMGVGP